MASPIPFRVESLRIVAANCTAAPSSTCDVSLTAEQDGDIYSHILRAPSGPVVYLKCDLLSGEAWEGFPLIDGSV